MDLVCPNCGGRIHYPDRNQELIHCECGKDWPVLIGIPDLRLGQDPYAGNDHDLWIARDLANQFPNMSFSELVHYYYKQHCPELKQSDVDRQLTHIQAGTYLATSFVELIESKAGSELQLLDLGTGAGGGLVGFMENHKTRKAVGLDVAMRWLILARKRLDENGLQHVMLVCALAESTPFADHSFDVIHAGDMIEHVAQPDRVFSESCRLLKSGGFAWFPTPNRTSLSREPHVGLFGAGWLPRKFTPAYCRLRGVSPWRGIYTRTAWSWLKLLKNTTSYNKLCKFKLEPGKVRELSRSDSSLASIYNRLLLSSAVFRFVALWFGPILEVTLQLQSDASSNPSTPFSKTPAQKQ